MPLASRRLTFTLTVVGVLSLAFGSFASAQDPVPGLGTWTLNVAKSKYTPGPTPKSGTVTFSAAGQAVKAVVDIVSDTGKIHWEYTATLDGKPAPVTGNPDGDMVMAKRTNPMTIETSYTLKGKRQKVNNVQVFEKK
jgi:hypothetical protein